MTALTSPQSGDALGAAVEHPHRQATAALTGPHPRPLDAVAWLSAHLAAVDHVVYPIAQHLLPHGRTAIRHQCAVDQRLQGVLWLLDRRLTGDGHSARIPVEAVVDELRGCLGEHTAFERELLDRVSGQLSADRQRELADRLDAAMRRAPTRPHPFTPHVGMPGSIAFLIDALIDQLREGLDSRPLPTPRATRAPHPTGRWGLYLMGASVAQPSVPEPDRRPARRSDLPRLPGR